MSIIPPKDYLVGLRWMKELDSSDKEVRSKAEETPPKKFSGNSNKSFASTDIGFSTADSQQEIDQSTRISSARLKERIGVSAILDHIFDYLNQPPLPLRPK